MGDPPSSTNIHTPSTAAASSSRAISAFLALRTRRAAFLFRVAIGIDSSFCRRKVLKAPRETVFRRSRGVIDYLNRRGATSSPIGRVRYS